ncbi:MAG: hypothetical protein KAX32_02135, partial [Candidatus Heimdallarchaeota archaeon]|nr:hypothetical protein [Candidatus Heimdallarchaeota archaeon]
FLLFFFFFPVFPNFFLVIVKLLYEPFSYLLGELLFLISSATEEHFKICENSLFVITVAIGVK